MFREFLASGTLNLVYAGVVLTSFIFAVITLLGAEIGDAFDFDLDMDVDADGGFDFVSVSPFALAMFGAVVSIIALTLGEIILIETVSSFTNKIKGRLSNKDGWRTLQAIAVYGSRHYGKYQRAAEFLIYGSLAWFCVYILICLLMIADI